MVRNYVRRTNRQSWSIERMEAAIQAVRGGSCKKTAARDFDVPIMALKRRLKNPDVSPKKGLGHFDCVFNEEQEAELVSHILDMETRMYGLTTRDVRCLAFQLAEQNVINHPFSKTKQAAGQDWFTAFKKRHPELTIRSPEATSVARARAFNKPVVAQFYKLVKAEVVEKNIAAHRIFNVDETSLNTVPGKNSRVVAKTGRKQVARITSAERGISTTAVICASAGGNFVPPQLIFKRKRMKDELKDGAPPGSIFSCNESGWMNTEVFSTWFDHFLNHIKPTAEDPVLLFLDGHNSHTKNLKVIAKARDNHVVIICLPPHTTHRLQPLDVAVMFPLSRYLDQSLEKWLNNHPGRTVSVFQMSSIFCEAYLKACTPENALKGFQKTGIFPYNDGLFTDLDFAAAEVTDIDPPNIVPVPVNELVEGSATQDNNLEPIPSTSSACDSRAESHQDPSETRHCTPEPNEIDDVESPLASEASVSSPLKIRPVSKSPSKLRINTDKVSETAFPVASPSFIRPIPKLSGPRKMMTRKTGKTAIITSSPYKNELEADLNRKEQADRMKKRKMENKEQKQIGVTKQATKKSKRSRCSKNTPENDNVSTSSSSEEDGDTECMVCGEKYTASSNEGWIQCSSCYSWAHDACAGVDEDDDNYICDVNCTTSYYIPRKKKVN